MAIWFLWVLLPASAQDYILHSQFYGIEEGLFHWDVQAIHQDKKGFIWLGTNYGLNCFDGYHLKCTTSKKIIHKALLILGKTIPHKSLILSFKQTI